MRAAALAFAALAWSTAALATPPGSPQPLHPRAAVVIEPPRIGVGQIAEVAVVAVTAPGHRLLPIEAPATLDGLWVLDAVIEPVEREALRWTHRTRIRVRGRNAGPALWPELDLAIEGPEGERWTLRTEPRPLEVVSVLEEFPDRVAPFSYRLPDVEPAVPIWVATAAGAAGTLVAVLAVGALRRRRLRGRESAEPHLTEAPWTAALDEVASADDDFDWRGASDRAARALRRYVRRRFGIPLESCTTEEIEARTPPFVLASRWPGLLVLLRSLDADRFRAEGDARAVERLHAVLSDARDWIEDSIPPEAEP